MIKNQNLLIAALTFTNLFCSFESKAFDSSILKNDKELVSRSYTKMDRILALKKTAASSPKAFALLGESINELEKSDSLCDTNLVQTLKEKLSQQGFPTTQDFLIHLLISWRAGNLIDDVFLKVFEQAVILDHELETTRSLQPSSKELLDSEKLLKKLEITSNDLLPLYENVKKFTRKNQTCSTNAWIQLNNQLSSLKGKNNKNLRSLNIIALQHQLISADTFDLLEAYRLNQVQDWKITLQRYLPALAEIKNSARPSVSKPEDLKTNELSSKIKDKKSDITYRASLYYRFNANQIKMLSDLLKKTFERMDANKAELTFTYPGGGKETIPLTPMGQYQVARRLLRMDMIDLSKSSFFGGAGISSEDVLTAALETGLINSEQLDSALKIDDLWNPNVPRWAKLKNFALSVTGTATIFLPAPYNLITSIALVFLNGQISKKAAKPDPRDNPYDIF